MAKGNIKFLLKFVSDLYNFNSPVINPQKTNLLNMRNITRGF